MSSNDRVETLLALLREEPEDVFLNYALALEYLKSAETELKAEELLISVIHKQQGYLAAYYQLGRLYENRQNFAMARKQFENGLKKATEQKNRKAASEFEEAIFMLED